MLVRNELNAINVLIDVANHVDDGSIQKYFNGFTLDGTGVFEIIETIIALEELGADNMDLPESEKEKIIFATLLWIKSAIDHDKKAINFFDKVKCKKHTNWMSYTTYINSILTNKESGISRSYSKGSVHIEGFDGCKSYCH